MLGESCMAQTSSQGDKKERQTGTKMPPREALADILERKCGPNGVHETKNYENVGITKTLKNYWFFYVFHRFGGIWGLKNHENRKKFE